MRSARCALDALSLRQRVIADNIANVNTPGFLAGRVQFEDALCLLKDLLKNRVSMRLIRHYRHQYR